MKSLFFIILVTLFSISYQAFAEPGKLDIRGELSPHELAQVSSRGLILKLDESAKNSPWPEITYYAVIDATPLESIGLFCAYDIQKNYVPNLLKSTPVKHVSPTDVHTAYELHMPFPLSNIKYIHGARIFQHGEDYQTVWYMVESTSTDEVRGEAYFANYNGKTLFRYRSYVKPKSIFAGILKKSMLSDVQVSIKSIREFIENEKRENTEFLRKYSEFITRALRGEFVYQTIINKK